MLSWLLETLCSVSLNYDIDVLPLTSGTRLMELELLKQYHKQDMLDKREPGTEYISVTARVDFEGCCGQHGEESVAENHHS